MTTDLTDFFINLAKINAIVYRKLDASLGWIWFNDYIILHTLSSAAWWKMRRIDLADKIWLTASWVTRLLLPMEKIWLVWREINENDARVSYVILAQGGKTKLLEAQERLDLLFLDTIPASKTKNIVKMTDLLIELTRWFR